MELSAEQKEYVKKVRLKALVGGLLGGILLVIIGVLLLSHRPGGFYFKGLVIKHITGPKDTPIVMEGGSIHLHSDLSWTVDPQLSTRYTTDLPDNIKAIVVRYADDETREVGHINLKSDDWSITVQEQTPDQPSGTLRDALNIVPAYQQGGSNKTIVVNASGVLSPDSGTDLRFRYKPKTCTDSPQNNCDLLSQIVIKAYHQPDQTILCTSGTGAGKCKIKFRQKKCGSDNSPCEPEHN